MTDDVIPSPGGDSNGYIVARLIEYTGGSSGWIRKSSAALLADNDPQLNQSAVPLNAFDESHSSSSFDVTIDTGEGFVGGAWLARDVTTTVSLSSSTNGQDVYVGWDHDATETVVIGTSSDFASEDPTLHIWTFDTDGSGVTNATDHRPIGQGSDLGSVTLDDGSDIGRWLATAITDTAVGTEGDHNNEIFRAAGNTSDMVYAVDDGDGSFSLAYNAYFDGSWKFTAGNTRAYLLQFSSDEIRLRTSASTAAADDPVTWVDIAVTDGDLVDNAGNIFYDLGNNEVPQARLGGPADSLSNYPLPHGDINDGSGSNLDADTVDGKEASELQGGTGEWTEIQSFSDSDGTLDVDFDTGTLSTVYDVYRVVWKAHYTDADNTYNEGALRLNGISTSDYFNTSLKGSTGVPTQASETRFENLGKVDQNETREGFADIVIRGVSAYDELSPSLTDYPSEPSNRHVVVSARHCSGTHDTLQFANGTLRQDVAQVDRLNIYSFYDAVAQCTVYGKNL
jgi:hypothetical protein